jgi:hypothetical protein
VHGGDRGLELIRADPAQARGALEHPMALVDALAVPERAVLVFEQDQLAFGSGAGFAP